MQCDPYVSKNVTSYKHLHSISNCCWGLLRSCLDNKSCLVFCYWVQHLFSLSCRGTAGHQTEGGDQPAKGTGEESKISWWCWWPEDDGCCRLKGFGGTGHWTAKGDSQTAKRKRETGKIGESRVHQNFPGHQRWCESLFRQHWQLWCVKFTLVYF